MSKLPTKRAEVCELKDGTFQVVVPIPDQPLPHKLPYEFISEAAAETWIASAEGEKIIAQVIEKHVKR
jgi:hypothetical protein